MLPVCDKRHCILEFSKINFFRLCAKCAFWNIPKCIYVHSRTSLFSCGLKLKVEREFRPSMHPLANEQSAKSHIFLQNTHRVPVYVHLLGVYKQPPLKK